MIASRSLHRRVLASRRWRAGLLALMASCAWVDPAGAIPAFARRYKMSCVTCHNVVPALSEFGEQFAGNGFRMVSGEEPTDTIGTGDDALVLLQHLPLAVRLDAYMQTYAGNRAVTDFQTPYSLKLLSSGAISRKISWYFYAFLLERGEVGGVEDAFLVYDDVGGAPVDVAVGQFQVSDPLFKRELRLEFEDYAVYRARLGDALADLTYDRGVMVTADALGFALTGIVVNGNGRGAATDERRYDVDAGKNAMLRVSRDLGGGIRLGGFGLYGDAEAENLVDNETTMLGADGTFATGPVEVNLQYVHREDDRPTFELADEGAELDGGFAEVLVRPAGSRWYGFGLYNLVTADRPILDVRLDTPGGVRRYETLTGGVGYQLQRNLRVTGETTWDMEMERTRWTLGFVSAF